MMKKRVFSGARPTGRQHIGNYIGAIQNYVALQEEYDCVYCIVDVHALTSLEDTGKLQNNIHEMMLDWLAAGLDPKRSILFVQSDVPEVLELHTLLSMITPMSWLLRVPTFKEKAKTQPHNVNYGLVGYPVLMTADIVIYHAEVVPVGEDQLPHLELTREIVRRFNTIFGPTL
jgi:tryptophanyl-tRNA synthetase